MALEIEVNTLKDANKKLTEELKAANLRIHSLAVKNTAIDKPQIEDLNIMVKDLVKKEQTPR